MDSTITPEPDLSTGEYALQQAVVIEIRRLLHTRDVPFMLVEEFGLDIAVWIRKDTSISPKFLELKVFRNARPGGVGFGNNHGQGPQVNLLIHDEEALQLLDPSTRWILGNGTRQPGTPRYTIATSSFAKKAAMGVVERGKQNNFRVADFDKHSITWAKLCDELRVFLLQ